MSEWNVSAKTDLPRSALDDLAFGKKEPVNISSSENWLEDDDKETIILFGAAKVGKTYAYLSIIDEELTSNPNATIHIINTDGGVARSFKEFFGDRVDEVRKRIKYYFVADIKQAMDAIKKVRLEMKPTDWVVMDLLSDFWEMAQDEFVRQTAPEGDIVNYMINASKDVKKFGLFEANKWNYIKKIDNELSMYLPSHPVCNVLGVCAEKDLAVEDAMSKGKTTEMVSLYRQLMTRPAGQKQITYKFNTIVYLTHDSKKHQAIIFGDRGRLKVGTEFEFDKSFWKSFKEARNKVKS